MPDWCGSVEGNVQGSWFVWCLGLVLFFLWGLRLLRGSGWGWCVVAVGVESDVVLWGSGCDSVAIFSGSIEGISAVGLGSF